MRNPEKGVAVILVLIFLLLMSVLAIGFMVSVSNTSQTAQSLRRVAIAENAAFSAQAHAIAAIHLHFDIEDHTSYELQGNRWLLPFKYDGDTFDSVNSHSYHLIYDDHPNDLWGHTLGFRRMESGTDVHIGGGMNLIRRTGGGGLEPSAQAFNDEYLSHEMQGEGMWRTLAYYDKDGQDLESGIEETTIPDGARFAARYAVDIVDLSGRLLINPAKNPAELENVTDSRGIDGIVPSGYYVNMSGSPLDESTQSYVYCDRSPNHPGANPGTYIVNPNVRSAVIASAGASITYLDKSAEELTTVEQIEAAIDANSVDYIVSPQTVSVTYRGPLDAQPRQRKIELVGHMIYTALDDTPSNPHVGLYEGHGASGRRSRPAAFPEQTQTTIIGDLDDPGPQIHHYTMSNRRLSQRMTSTHEHFGYDLFNWGQIANALVQYGYRDVLEYPPNARVPFLHPFEEGVHQDETEVDAVKYSWRRASGNSPIWDYVYLMTPFGNAVNPDGSYANDPDAPAYDPGNPMQWTVNAKTAPLKVLQALVLAMDEIKAFEDRHYRVKKGRLSSDTVGIEYTWVRKKQWKFEREITEDDITWYVFEIQMDGDDFVDADPNDALTETNPHALAFLNMHQREYESLVEEHDFAGADTASRNIAADIMNSDHPAAVALRDGKHYMRVQEMKSPFFRIAIRGEFYDIHSGETIKEARSDFVYHIQPKENDPTKSDANRSFIMYMDIPQRARSHQ